MPPGQSRAGATFVGRHRRDQSRPNGPRLRSTGRTSFSGKIVFYPVSDRRV
jgi:hypothetical protein